MALGMVQEGGFDEGQMCTRINPIGAKLHGAMSLEGEIDRAGW